MNNEEKDLIRSRLCDLILHTDCNTDFLTFFQEKGILTIFDIESIAAKNEGSERASEFYGIIKTRTNAFQMLLEGLKETRQIMALEILAGTKEGEDVSLSAQDVRNRVRKLLRDDSILRSSIFFDVEPPVYLFTGRTKESEELHKMILKSKEGKTMTVISQLATVSGLGGIGKTQLARQYINKKSSFFNKNVIWLNAEDQGSLSTSFRRLAAEKLKLSTKDGNGVEQSAKAVAEEVYKCFESRRALFVFDNAVFREDGGPWLRELLPNPKNNPEVYVLMTSRNNEWGVGAKVMPLGELTQAEAVSMVKLGLEIIEEDNQEEIIIKLTETLQCFPLALHQAISYIHEQRQILKEYSIQAYISEFENRNQEVLLSYRDVDSLNDTYMLTTATTWKITMNRILTKKDFVGKIAFHLLTIMSYYSPTNINRDLFYALPLYKGGATSQDKEKFKKEITINNVNAAIRLLVKYSIINSSGPDQSMLNIHLLVQAVIRIELEKNKDGIPFAFANFCLLNYFDENRITSRENIFQHAIQIWRYSAKHPKGIILVKNLVFTVFKKMLVTGRLVEGISLCNEAVEKYNEILGENDKFCLKIQHILAIMLALNCEMEMSLKFLNELVVKSQSIFGEESVIFLDIKSTLFSIRNMLLKDTGSSVALLNSELEMKKFTFDEGYEHTPEAQNTLVEFLMDMGHPNEALEIFANLIDKRKAIYGGDNNIKWKAIKVEQNIAKNYLKVGREQEAIQLYQTAYNNIHKILDKSDATLGLFALFCLDYADALENTGEGENALKILENCEQRLRKIYGNKHQCIPDLLDKIGDIQVTIGEFSKAYKSHLEALQCAKTIYGNKSALLFRYEESIAFDLLHLGKIDESMCLLENVCTEMSHLGIFSPKILRFIPLLRLSGNNLGVLQLQIKIQHLLSSDFAADSQLMAKFSKEIKITQEKIYVEKELKSVAMSVVLKNITLEEAHPKFQKCVNNISLNPYDNMDVYALNGLLMARFGIQLNAFTISLEILEICRSSMEMRLIMTNQKPTIYVLIAIGDAYFGMKNYEHSLSHHQAAYDKLSDIFGDLHVTTIETKIRISKDLFCKGNHEESLRLFEKVAEILLELENNNTDNNDLTLNMLNYAMETITILFKEDNPRFKHISAVIEKIQNTFEPKALNDQLSCAEAFITRGNYDEALTIYQQVYYKGDSPIWKADISEVASVCKNLAQVLNQLSKHEEAIEILEGNLELVKLNLGGEHHSTYLLQGCLANAHRGMGNFQEALYLHQMAYQGLLITLMEDHEEMLNLRKEIDTDLNLIKAFGAFNRAEDFINAGNYEKALKIYKEEIYRKGDGLIYKANINLFSSTGKNVAFVLNKIGKREESVEFLEKVLELVKAKVGNEHFLTFSLMWNLASLHQSQGRFDMALDIRKKAFKSLKNKPIIKIIL